MSLSRAIALHWLAQLKITASHAKIQRHKDKYRDQYMKTQIQQSGTRSEQSKMKRKLQQRKKRSKNKRDREKSVQSVHPTASAY